jgi:amino acid adenylation domain-containing protein
MTTRYADAPPLHERFEAQAEKTPDAIALVFEATRITYRELNERANRLAHRLQHLGVGPESLVALSMERSVELVVGILGILKAGGAYVPLDPAYPRDRLEFMLADSQAKVIVTHAAVKAGATPPPTPPSTPPDLHTVFVEDTESESAANVRSGVTPDNVAYVIYTSGSTGRPKGVLVTHGNVVRLFEATDAWYHFGTSDVWTLFHSYAFDFSVWELWGALAYGGRLVVVPYWVSRSPDAFYQLLASEGVTVLNQTPSAFRQLIHAVAASPVDRPLALREVIFGGEALELQGLRPWLERFGDQRPRLVNMYGITETTVHVTYRPIAWADVRAGLGSVIGVPIPDLGIHLLDEAMNPVAEGESGEIFVEGGGLARGYLNRPDLSAQRFMARELEGRPVRLYRTGDLARRLPGGELEYLGRIDLQVKIRGFRIELGEIESAIAEHPKVREVVVIAREDTPGDKRLVAYVTPGVTGLVEELKAALRQRLPDYMVPTAFVGMEKLPLTENGKVDRKALPAPNTSRPELEAAFVEPEGPLETAIAEVWRRLLRVDRVGANDGFFDLGGSSLLAVESLLELRREVGRTVPVVALFQHPTVRGLARSLGATGAARAPVEDVLARAERQRSGRRDSIAIIGMAGRFPGAANLRQLWDNLCRGVESVRFFSDAELDPRVDASVPGYVKARGVIDDADRFDAAFFGEAPANAEFIDPQQRVLLEVAWAALEDAGVVPERHGASIGVFAGTGHNTYLLKNLVHRPDRIAAMGELALTVGNDRDFVATRIAHKLNLKGPAVSVQTACSTSLVATFQAVRSLLDHECDVALAGAASVTVPQNAGHVYAEGAMLSSDGHTRSFDASATGTVFSDGAGMVVLKRLADAQRDGDRIYAVIRGAAINNDGAEKASFTAPSVAGQAAAIAMAHAAADIDPATITYVEAHGTATPLGDPIEVEALAQAFRARTPALGFCALGSIKSNFGHQTAASGVAGLIKTALSIHHGKLVPSLFFERPNPNIDFAATPFFVQTKFEDWRPPNGLPRRAGVSSFGVGGTNAHVVLEEAPAPVPPGARRPVELLLLSAKSEAALDRASAQLATYLGEQAEHAEHDLADVAYTLQARRASFAYRRFVTCRSTADAVSQLVKPAEPSQKRKLERGRDAPVAFVFPGQGTQYVGMGRALYDVEPVFKRAVDLCSEILRPELGRDLREVLFPAPADAAAAEASLRQTSFTQPALFTLEYALASLWQSWGLQPVAFAGHSVGEFVAACLAGVFTVEDAVKLVGQRGRLMQALPPGSMLSVRAPAAAIEARVAGGLALAASNGPSLCVVAGPTDEVQRFQVQLESEGITTKLLFTSHAFHSPMIEPAVAPFAELVRRVGPRAPKVPIVSTATGRLLTADEATSAEYWARHMRVPVRFMEALRTLWTGPATEPSRILLEVGPRGTSATLARQIVTDRARQIAIASLADSSEAEWPTLAQAIGQLWLAGVSIDWEAFQAIGRRRLVSLPSYPFARDRHFIDPPDAAPRPRSAEAPRPTAMTNGHSSRVIDLPAAAMTPSVGRPHVASVQIAAPEAVVSIEIAAPEAVVSPDAMAEVVAAQLRLMEAQLAALQASDDGSTNAE